MRILTVIACVLISGFSSACGSDDNGSATLPEPTVSPVPPPTATQTETTAKKKGKKDKQPTQTQTTQASSLPPEQPCGTIFFPGTGSEAPVSALNLPCAKAKAYAEKFVSGQLPSQENLPPGWQLGSCTGILDNPPTPGEPNSPRCTKGDQAFTIHLPK